MRSAGALALTCVLVLALAAAVPPAGAQASPSLTWTRPAEMPSGVTPTAVSCASESLCAAVDAQGDALTTSDPTASDPSWSKAEIDHPGAPFDAVSCAAEGLCAAVDGHGDVFVNRTPGTSLWSGKSIDGNVAITGVSCPSASLCVAVDKSGNVLSSTSPGSGAWSSPELIDKSSLKAVSCAPSPLSCVAVDDAGEVLASGEPTNSASWHGHRVDFGELVGASCASLASVVSGTPGVLCAAVDAGDDTLASEDPGSVPATWNLTPIDLGQSFAAVSCASSGLCVAVDGHGGAFASDHPAGVSPAWTSTGIDEGRAIAGVSCLPGGFCMAVDAAGHSLSARVPAPQATTSVPTEVTSSSAQLVGEVNPNDAVLGACTFEYGAAGSGLYTQGVPCSATPAANGGSQRVSAQLTGLAPNTAYRYRISAASAAGPGVGGETVFTTAASPLVAVVTPSPSIVGTPAVGQRLACHPGTPAGVTLAYVWLRDLLVIPGATGSNYTVTGQDSGHHLQCQVTATDAGGSATARSAFVTIPLGGVPASAGETTVGAATFRSGRVSVPVTCSSRASGGCEVTVRLQASETLSGRRIVAVAARAGHRSHGGEATVRHVTITLASARVHIQTGAHVTVSATLSATAKRLLAARRRFSSYLYVSGTVIGVLEAQLAKQLLTLNAASHSAAVHARRR